MSETTVNSTFDQHRSPFTGSAQIWIAVGLASWAVAVSTGIGVVAGNPGASR